MCWKDLKTEFDADVSEILRFFLSLCTLASWVHAAWPGMYQLCELQPYMEYMYLLFKPHGV
jgi:hypothetical protein